LYDLNIRQSKLNYDYREESAETENQIVTIESAANTLPIENIEKVVEGENKEPYQIHNKYIIHQIKSGMIIINQSLAHERILFERFLEALEVKPMGSQQCLFPQAIDLNPSDFNLIMELEEEIKALGFQFSVLGRNTIAINGVPPEVQAGREKELFEGLIEQFKRNKSELSIGKTENIARSLAKRSAMKPGSKLTTLEMTSLIDQLFACNNSNYSPGGDLTFVTFNMEKLDSFFIQRTR
jgi:DNA mismatch repair protein MutL